MVQWNTEDCQVHERSPIKNLTLKSRASSSPYLPLAEQQQQQQQHVGLIPGAEGNFVFIKDVGYKKPDISMLSFPTYFAPEDENIEELEPLAVDLKK
ncbi:hypothetical protein LOK49_LG08G03439 [Camellia lanceoleosa]|uniref:Uncharacterized protein n=1 Tax=Camellia lanceoleosa TaxID=1840588 RepID=A0ACC0GN84_9ERIC|nr:hypothetical protein LOK49_LG08G03439 [Camellia lanceoleosa]